MIGIGKWKFKVNIMFFNGDVTLVISEKNNTYDFSAEIPGVRELPEYHINEIKEKGNTLYVRAGSSLLPGKEVEAELKFEGDFCDATVIAPYVGKIVVENGVKIG